LLAAPAALVPLLVVLAFGDRPVELGGWAHFAGVGLAAAVATAAALALTVAGAIVGDGRAVLAGLAFSLMAALLCLHGAATPGILVGMNGVVAFTGGATLPVGCAILALGSVPELRRPSAVRPLLVGLVVGSVGILVLGVTMIRWPALVPAVPAPRSPLALTVLAAGLGACALLATRAFRTYRLTRRTADLVVVVGISWLAASLVGALIYDYRDVGWWLGHALEIGGIAIVGIPVALDLRRVAAQRSGPLWGHLRGADLVAAEEAFLGSHVRALLVALAAKDGSTEEHTRRVARLAVDVGEELGLAAGRLRSLATGGLLHDIGKLVVPDAVLGKPAALTREEFALVARHTTAGVELLRELGGFDPLVHALVHDHHERLDGSGYPRGLCREEISLEARILAVCDVYDALISPRVYRDAWEPERALALLHDGAGEQFDGRCVAALDRVLAASAQRGELARPRRVPYQATASEAFLSAR
jgi:putative nucleotidyltransferase with HDIG domain